MDLITFGVAVTAVWLISIPRPPITTEGLAATGGWLAELIGGLRYIVRMPGLLSFLLYETTIYFLLNGPLDLALPYTISRTGSEAVAGALLGLTSLGALAMSMLQTKLPPDMQGRIFAVRDQLGYLGATASFLLVGPLVDRVPEPAVGGPRWDAVAPLVGGEPGSGMGLLLVVTGLLILAVTALAALNPGVRWLEARLPDYETDGAELRELQEGG